MVASQVVHALHRGGNEGATHPGALAEPASSLGRWKTAAPTRLHRLALVPLGTPLRARPALALGMTLGCCSIWRQLSWRRDFIVHTLDPAAEVTPHGIETSQRFGPRVRQHSCQGRTPARAPLL